jgi:hypothetical protein
MGKRSVGLYCEEGVWGLFGCGLVGAVDVLAQWRGDGFEGWRGGVVGRSVGRHGVVKPSLSCGRLEVGRTILLVVILVFVFVFVVVVVVVVVG